MTIVVSESIRLYPPAWVIAGPAIERVTIGGVEVKLEGGF
jgi:cytochrome P450